MSIAADKIPQYKIPDSTRKSLLSWKGLAKRMVGCMVQVQIQGA